MTRKLLHTLIVLAVVVAGCDDGNGDTDQDTMTDPDVVEDTAVDTAVDSTEDSVEDTVVADTAEDTEDASETPVGCSGSDSLTLEFLFPDDSPVSGVAVALGCLGEVRTAPSGPDGRVTFANLDLATQPVDITFIHEAEAFSIVGVGGSRAVPDPFTFTMADPDPPVDPDPVPMVGDIVHSVADSWVALASTAPHWAYPTQEDRYEIYTVDDTGLNMVAVEYTSTGDTAVALGYLLVGYDTPDSGTDGPVLDFTSPDGSLDTVTLAISYDLVGDSPIPDTIVPTEVETPSTRTSTGMRVIGWDADDDFLMYGFTTDWTGGFTTDTMVVSYIAAGVSAASSTAGELILQDPNRNWIYAANLASSPSTWSTLTIHDLPQLPGFSAASPVTFATDFTVVFPSWGDAVMQYIIREDDYYGVLSMEDDVRWTVTVHPETTSFSFIDLPWPESVAYDDVFGPGSYHVGAISGFYTEDPYTDYRLWDGDWTDDNWAGFAHDSRYRMSTP